MNRMLIGLLSLIVFSPAQSQGPGAQVTITGEVLAPRTITVDKPVALQAVIAQAGGLSADAAVIEIRHRDSGTGPVTATTPAAEYHTLYVIRSVSATNPANDPFVTGGDFIVVRRKLELHPPMAAGQFGAGAYRINWASWGVAAPTVRASTEPQYTRAGMVLKLQGTVEVEAVVKADGTVSDARVTKGLDERLPDLVAELRRLNGTHEQEVLRIVGNGPIGLDANAIECVKSWKFTPGTILGEATPIIQPVSVQFKLK